MKAYRQLRKEHHDSVYYATACYRTGAIHEAAGHKKDALHDYMKAIEQGIGDYHAHRAHQRLHEFGQVTDSPATDLEIDGKHSFIRPFPLKAETLQDVPERVLKDPRCQRLYFFGENGFEEGEWETLALGVALRDAPDPGAYYQAIAEAGFACTALELADAADWGIHHGRPTPASQGPRAAPHARLRIAYPLAYWPHVSALAKATGVDPYLLLSVARQESTFRPALTSSAGARGLMQVMPATASWLAQVEPNVNQAHARHLDAPLNSLHIGAYYLMRMIERADGNLAYALASYNAGPGNVSKWRKRFPGADLDTFIESIPFSETRHYVKSVLGNYAAYHSLYPPLSLGSRGY